MNQGLQKKGKQNFSSSQPRPKSNEGKPGRSNKSKVTCAHCGYPHHSENCRFKDFDCNICGKKGHLKAVCWYKDSSPPLSSQHKKGEKKKRFIKLTIQQRVRLERIICLVFMICFQLNLSWLISNYMNMQYHLKWILVLVFLHCHKIGFSLYNYR